MDKQITENVASNFAGVLPDEGAVWWNWHVFVVVVPKLTYKAVFIGMLVYAFFYYAMCSMGVELNEKVSEQLEFIIRTLK